MLRSSTGSPILGSPIKTDIESFGGLQNVAFGSVKPRLFPQLRSPLRGAASPLRLQMKSPSLRLALQTDTNGRASLAAVPSDADTTLIDHVCIADVEYSANQLNRVVENQMGIDSDDIGGFAYDRTQSSPFEDITQPGTTISALNSPISHLPSPSASLALQTPPPPISLADLVNSSGDVDVDENEYENRDGIGEIDEIGLGGTLCRDDLTTSDHSEPENYLENHPEPAPQSKKIAKKNSKKNSDRDPSTLDLKSIDPEMLGNDALGQSGKPKRTPKAKHVKNNVTKRGRKRGHKKRACPELKELVEDLQSESCWLKQEDEIEKSHLFQRKSQEIAAMLARGPLTVDVDTAAQAEYDAEHGTYTLTDEQFIAFVAGKPLLNSSRAFLQSGAQLEVLMQLEAANRLGYKHEDDNVYLLQEEEDVQFLSNRTEILTERGLVSTRSRGVAHCGNRCPEVCKTYMALAAHIDSEHSAMWRPWKCNHEDCVFQVIGFHKCAEAKRHYRTSHAQVSSYCRLCARAYARTDALRRHYRTRHMHKPKERK